MIKGVRKNNNIKITKPDKRSGVVILDRTAYIDKMMNILGDDSTFINLGDSAACEIHRSQELDLKIKSLFPSQRCHCRRGRLSGKSGTSNSTGKKGRGGGDWESGR